MEDKRYAIEIEVITPLNIGGDKESDWTKGVDFVLQDGKIYVIDMHKVLDQGIDPDTLASNLIQGNEYKLKELLKGKLEKVAKKVLPSPVSASTIKTFIRTNYLDKPFIPGSSIKGSVRSALLKYLKGNIPRNPDMTGLFGNMADGSDFMRFIRIADVQMEETTLVNSKIFNLFNENGRWTGGWKHQLRRGNTNDYKSDGMNTLYECVPPGEKGIGNIELANVGFELFKNNLKQLNENRKYDKQIKITHQEQKEKILHSIEELFRIVNQYTKDYLRKEKHFFETYNNAERSNELVDCIGQLQEMIPTDGKSCLLKLGAGTGFHAITGDWKYDDYLEPIKHQGENNKRYKSRKTADYEGKLMLMGFVKISLVSEEEAAKAINENKKKAQERLEKLTEELRKAEERRQEELRKVEEQRKEEQRKTEEQRKAKELERQKELHYAELMEQANAKYGENHLDEARKLLEEARALYPGRADADTLETRINRDVSIAQAQAQRQQEQQERFGQPLEQVLQGKTSIGNLIDTTAKWLKKNNVEFDEQHYAILLEKIKTFSPKEMKNVRNSRKKLEALKEGLSERLFADLNI